MTTPISGVIGSTGAAQTKPTEETSGGKDMFMKMLVAQLRYQNPMSPTDGGQYMSQMAMFTQVEKLGQMVEAQQAQQVWQQRLTAESLVGRQVTGTDSDAQVHTGVVISVTFGTGDPTLTLADGSRLAIGDVSTVELQK